MASNNYEISVLNRGLTWVDLAVRQCHSDASPLNEQKLFALQLLRDGDPVGTSPLARELDELGMRTQADADRFVSSVRVYRALNVPYDEQRVVADRTAVLEALGLDPESEDWEDAWSAASVAWWASADGPFRGVVRLHVTAPRWIDHLSYGQRFFSIARIASAEQLVLETRDEDLETPADALVDGVGRLRLVAVR